MDSTLGTRPVGFPDMPTPFDEEQPQLQQSNARQVVCHCPAEILSAIFEHASFDSGVYLRPHIIASVCRCFRSAALRTPRIWTFIKMHDPEHTGFRMEREWLARSKGCDLTIDIDWSLPNWNGTQTHLLFTCNEMRYAVALLTAHAHRWKTFRMAADAYTPFRVLLQSLLPVHVPRLITLELVRTRAGDAPAFRPTRGDFVRVFHSGTPNLRRLVLTGVYVDWHHLPIGNLESFEVSYHAQNFRPTRGNLDAVLEGSPDLSRLVMHGSSPKKPHPLDKVYVLSNLRHLHLGMWTPRCASDIVRVYHAPHLRSLVLDWIVDAFAGTAPAVFFDTIVANGLMGELEELTLRRTDIDIATFSRVTAYFSQLKTLRLFPISAEAHLFLWSLPTPGPANVLLGPCNVDAINVPSVRQFEQLQPGVNVDL